MRHRLALVTLALLAATCSATAGDLEDLEQAVTELNRAFGQRDLKKVTALLSKDHRAAVPFSGAVLDWDTQLKSLPDLKITVYDAKKFTTKLLGPDAALVTYPLTIKGTYKDKPFAMVGYASAVWVKEKGTWVEVHYQETPFEK